MAFTDHKLKFTIDADGKAARSELLEIDHLIGKVGSGLGSWAGPAAIAATGVAAIGAAAVGATAALFNLTKTAADYGSTIFDASKKTGLHAEALSAMDFAAKQSGTSLEQVTGGVAKFAKNVGAAADDTKKATAFLKDFGITPQAAIADLDGALDKVFKRIIAAPPGIERMTLAQKAFGKSGADLLPFIDSFDGDLAGLIKRAKALGVTITDDAAAAADKFGDQMDELGSQLAGVGRTIGTELMGPFTDMAKDIGSWLAENKDTWKAWGETAAGALQRVAKEAAATASWFDQHPNFTEFLRQAAGVALSGPGYMGQSLLSGPGATKSFKVGWGGAMSEVPDKTTSPFGGGTTGGGGGANKKVADKLPAFGSMKSLVISSGNAQWDAWFNQMGSRFNVDPNILLLQSGAESSHNAGAVSPKGAKGFSQFMPGTAARFGVDTSSVKDSIRGQAQYMSSLLSMFGGDYSKALAGYNAGEGAVQKYGGIPPFRETRGYVSKIQSQYRSRVTKDKGGYGTFDPESLLSGDADESEIRAGLRQLASEMIAAEQQASDSRLSIRQKEAEQAQEIIKGMVLNGEMTETEAVERVGQLRIDMILEEQKELEAQIPTAVNLQRLEEIRLELDTERLKQANEKLQTEKEISAEINKQISSLKKANQRPGLQKRETYQERIERMGATTVGSGQEIGAMGQLHDYFVSEGNTAAIAGVDALAQAFGGLGQAIGATVEAWVLYGSVGEGAQEVTAKILASIAQQAAIKAIFELAEGFAMLGLAFFGHPGAGPSATQHFIAAGMYGAIAGGAAVLGRAVAGDSMKKGGSASGSRSSSSSSGQQREVTPYSRQTDDVYMSGSRNAATSVLARAVEKLEKKISAMNPGDVLVAGSRQRKGFIGTQAVDDMKTRPQLGTRLLRQANAR